MQPPLATRDLQLRLSRPRQSQSPPDPKQWKWTPLVNVAHLLRTSACTACSTIYACTVANQTTRLPRVPHSLLARPCKLANLRSHSLSLLPPTLSREKTKLMFELGVDHERRNPSSEQTP